ncbi:MAG: VOC family protein [Stagnimonas sp.]|nr:VOC family protein [Stagnimonas sp.]
MQFPHKIAPCLWFDTQGEAAAQFYCGIFPNSRITEIGRYPDNDHAAHRDRAGTAMTVAFELAGQSFTALNGGPHFKFTEAISLQVYTDDQAETDHYWNALGAGCDPKTQQCGWLKDRYGLSWQIVPKAVIDILGGPDRARAAKAMAAVMQMKNIDIAAVQKAAAA